MTLDELAIKYGTDKSSIWHNYTEYYARLFDPLKEKIRGVLELGVNKGKSLLTWAEYFPNAKIAGIDINPECDANFDNRIKVFIGNQMSARTLQDAIAWLRGDIDLIIDDAAHINKYMISTFYYLFPSLNPGGIYIMEDTQCLFELERGNVYLEMEDFILRITRDIYSNYRMLCSGNCADFNKIDFDNILTYTERHIERLGISRGIIAIYKRMR